MAIPWFKILTIAAGFLTICEVQGDDCDEVERDLTRCLMYSQLDFDRLTDPSYVPELCREVNRLSGCVEEARDECPYLAMLTGDSGRSIDQMVQRSRSFCPENPVENCPNPSGDVVDCARPLQMANEYNMCRLARQYVVCIEGIRDRCEDHPMMTKMNMEESLDSMEGMISSMCN